MPCITKLLSLSVATAIAASTAVLLAPAASASTALDSTPCIKRVVVAHEGYKANADGDTIDSQIAAYDIGANVADTDIWKTFDNFYVERHDNDLSTSTNADPGTLITNLTLAQVQAFHTTQHSEPIPQVMDSLALTQFNAPYRYLQFETKWSMNGTWALKAVDDQIKAAGMSAHVIIYSAYLSQLQYLSGIDPTLTLWYKAGNPPPLSDLTGLDGVMLDQSQITKTTVATYHNAGYTVTRGRTPLETDAGWTHFVRTGADALMTDDPAATVTRCKALP